MGRLWRCKSLVGRQAKLPRLLSNTAPRFLAEPLEARCLLSGAPGATATLPDANLPAGWQATPIADPYFLNGPDYAGCATPHGLSPNQIRGAYGLGSYTNGNLSNGISFGGIAGDGRGQTIAIIDAYDDPNANSDINAFSNYYGLPTFGGAGNPTFQKLNQYGNSSALPGTDPNGPSDVRGGSDWEMEESLDIEWAHAIAPMANILLFEASNADTGLFTAISAARNTPGVVAVSMSWSEGEFYGESNFDTTYFTTPANHVGGSATVGGTGLPGNITFLAATGDYGAYSYGSSSISPQYPAASPNVVVVGGTYLTVSGSNPNYTYGSEIGWGNGTSSWSLGGSGGGISQYETQPSYQNGVVGNFSASQRTYPDVSIDGDPYSGVPIYDSWDFGNSTPWLKGYMGGTSLSAPLFAGIVAIADEGRAIAGKGSLDDASQTLPILYSLPASDFHDITSGSIGPSPTYTAASGYDLVSGLGTPIANLLIPALAGGSQLAFGQQPTNIVAGNTITPAVTVYVEDADGNLVSGDDSSVTLTVTGGQVTLLGTTTETAVNGVATFSDLSLNTAGNFTLNATDGLLVSATSGKITVTAAAATQLAFGQQPTGGVVGTIISPAITVAVEDQFGNIITSDNSSVTLATASGPASLSGNTTVAAVNGVATFGNVSLSVTGNYTLAATDGALAQAVSSSFAIWPIPPAWLSGNSAAIWDVDSQTLTVIGNATIIADPAGNITPAQVNINLTGNACLVVNTPVANLVSLTLAGGTTLDVQENIVTLGNTTTDSLNAIQAYVFAGQIFSSSVIPGSGYAVGYGNATIGNALCSEFRYTLKGDVDLDGSMSINDLSILLANYGQSTTQWSVGNFEYNPAYPALNASININDLSDVLGRYGMSVPAVAVVDAGARYAPATVAGSAAQSDNDIDADILN